MAGALFSPRHKARSIRLGATDTHESSALAHDMQATPTVPQAAGATRDLIFQGSAMVGVITVLLQALGSVAPSPAVLLALTSCLRTIVTVAAATTRADMAVYATYALFTHALLWPTACRVAHSMWPAFAKALELPKARRPPTLPRRLLRASVHVCCVLCVLGVAVLVRRVAELNISASELYRGFQRSHFPATDGTAPLHEEHTEPRVQRDIGDCAREAHACDHPTASLPVVRTLLWCVNDFLAKSTPAYSGPACSVEDAMQRVDLDRDSALNTTERDRALQIFVPDDVYDPYLLVFIAC